ncbi:MAG: hypothetical protein AAGI52_12970 [Bacteroidota bacterium]
MSDINWTFVIVTTTVGFFLLAFILLYPVYRFMRREEDIAEDWTDEAIARRQRQSRGGRVAKRGEGRRNG